MANTLLEKLLNVAWARGADGLLLAAGYPPTLFLNNEMVDLETRLLDQEDVIACAECLGLTLSDTETQHTFDYRNTGVHATTSHDRVVVRFGT
jgi:hypothetical protein